MRGLFSKQSNVNEKSASAHFVSQISCKSLTWPMKGIAALFGIFDKRTITRRVYTVPRLPGLGLWAGC